MFCIRCGNGLPDEAAFCPSCGAPVASVPDAGGSAAPPAAIPGPWSAAPAAPAAAVTTPSYAGFWRRLWSYLIDRFILGVLFTPVAFLVILPVAASQSSDWMDTDLPGEAIAAVMGAVLTVVFLALLASWLYYALMQSSSRQATLGQMALGLRVTDLEGRRISLGRASGRLFATVLTGMTFGLGYLAVLFTSRKQTLHDLVAGTVVVR